jgi:hypothetical protein
MSRLRSIAVAATAVVAAIPIGAAAAPAHAAGSVPAAVSLTAPASGTYGTVITLQGRLWRYGTAYGIARSKVWLQRAPHGRSTWSSIASATTASTGGYAFRVTQTGGYDYRVYYGGSTVFRAALSPTRYPVTTQRMTFESLVTANASTGALRATGYVYPLPPDGQLVQLQRWDPEARAWHAIGSARTSGGRVVVTAIRPGSVNSYRLVVPARSSYGAGVSATKAFAHYVWRGAFARGGVVYASDSGNFSMPRPADNPRRDTIHTYNNPNARFEFGIDPSGCRQVATSSRWEYAGGALNLQMYNTTKMIDQETLYASSTVGMSGTHDPADPRLYFHINNPQAGGAGTTTRMALLCTN